MARPHVSSRDNRPPRVFGTGVYTRSTCGTARRDGRTHLLRKPDPDTMVPSRILIVEDDEVTNDQYARFLRLEGYDVRTALSAKAGLTEVQSMKPDAIIVDFRLPDVDGLQFLRLVRGDTANANIPVAVVTGDYFLDDSVPAQLLELRAEIVFKPLWLEDLTSLVRKMLDGDERPTLSD
jgi:two-component system OmpR family response regulator